MTTTPETVQFERSPTPLVSVVLTGWRSAPYLVACLGHLARAVADVEAEVIVSLNEPTDELVASLAAGVAGIEVLQSPINAGFGQAANRGAARARGAYLVMLNDDTEVEPDWLTTLVATIAGDPYIGAVGSRLLDLDGATQEAGSVLWSDGSPGAVGVVGTAGDRFDWARRVDYCSGASLLIRRDLFEQHGGFDDVFFPAYFEDTDLCLKLKSSGHEVWYQPLSVARHVHSASSSQRYAWFLHLRNRRRFVDRWRDYLDQLEDPPTTPGQGDAACQRRQAEAYSAAVWLAMGRPQRVLVVDPAPDVPDGGPGAVEALLAGGLSADRFYSLHHDGLADDHARRLAALGVRVVHGAVERHLREPGVTYDVVVAPDEGVRTSLTGLVRRFQPGAVLVALLGELPEAASRPPAPPVPRDAGADTAGDRDESDLGLLRRDVALRVAYAEELEAEVDRLHQVEHLFGENQAQLADVRAELEATTSRTAYRAADSLVDAIRRIPGAESLARRIHRLLSR